MVRSLAAPALSIFGSHSNVMAARGTGFASLSSGLPENKLSQIICTLVGAHSCAPLLRNIFFVGSPF
ncbi:hypothetical protein FACHB389_02265 [Nostoc calcicola FACHB-389]|nr:hypothetical protein FACHB389_02265 [Nostoc calcicola FACHB-389]